MDDHDVFAASSISDEGEQVPQSQSVDQADQLKGKQTRGRTWMSKITKKKRSEGQLQPILYNELGQVVGTRRSEFQSTLGAVVRLNVPLTTKNWNHVSMTVKNLIWDTMRVCSSLFITYCI